MGLGYWVKVRGWFRVGVGVRVSVSVRVKKFSMEVLIFFS